MLIENQDTANFNSTRRSRANEEGYRKRKNKRKTNMKKRRRRRKTRKK
jgi:hypothetical protein